MFCIGKMPHYETKEKISNDVSHVCHYEVSNNASLSLCVCVCVALFASLRDESPLSLIF